MTLLAAGCIENRIGPRGEPSQPTVADSVPDDTGGHADSDTATVIEEMCDGLDNDGDGAIDEGFPDSDGDGVLDCLDTGCAVVALPGGPETSHCTCADAPLPAGDPWAASQSWSFRDPDTAACTESAAADVDGDGRAEVICAGMGLYVLDSSSGQVAWGADSSEAGTFPSVAVADVDGDGSIEVLTGDSTTGVVRTYTGDGSPVWTSESAIGSVVDDAGMGWLGVADLDGDCVPEVVTAIGSVDAATGARGDQWGPTSGTRRYAHGLAVGDVDGDGRQDVFADWRRYTAGTLDWESRRSAATVKVVVPLLMQADDDDDGEVAWVSDLGLVIDDANGDELLYALPPGGDELGSVACAGDLDGDGREDVVGAGQSFVWAWDRDGTVMWSQPALDNSHGITGCAVIDFDGDGAYEVVFEAADRVAILDGTTGTSKWGDPHHISSTWGEVPMLVDVDDDGVVDLVATSEGYYDPATGNADLYVSPDGSWPAGTTIWASPNWSGTEIRPDGSVPRYPARPWLQYGIWRGQPNNPVFGADLKVTITDACTEDCSTGAAYIAVQVSNLGSEGAPADTPIAFYTLDELGNRTLVEGWELGELLWPGHAAAGKEFTLPVSSVLHGVVAVVGQSGAGTACAVPDCDESNNEATWVPDCPGQ